MTLSQLIVFKQVTRAVANWAQRASFLPPKDRQEVSAWPQGQSLRLKTPRFRLNPRLSRLAKKTG